jgi:hypothetical protein
MYGEIVSRNIWETVSSGSRTLFFVEQFALLV